MLDAWTWPAYVSIPLGIALFLVLLAPILALQSRRYGHVSPARLLGAAALAVYLTALAFYTIFPMPGPGWCSVHLSPEAQLTPLHSLDDIAEAIDGLSATQALRDVAVLQVVFNVLLFVPFGLLFRRLLGLGRIATVAAGAATSLLIETVQGTGAFGLVGCAYRVADVDDLITNTLGTLVGVALAPLILRWMPGSRLLAEGRGTARPVTRGRRLAAALIDLFVLFVVASGLTVLYRAYVMYALGDPLPGTDDWLNQAVPNLVGLTVVVLPCLVGSHASLGQRALWLRPSGNRLAATIRPWFGVGGYALLSAVAVLPPVVDTDLSRWCDTGSMVILAVSALLIVFDRSARGLSFRITGQSLVDTRS